MAKAFGFEWDRDFEVFISDAQRTMIAQIENGLNSIVQRYAPLIENWMKQNARWEDRTGDARRLLNTDLEIVVGEMYAITLDHGVEYGKYLELKHQGRFAIIQPALDYWGPKVFDAVRRFMNGRIGI